MKRILLVFMIMLLFISSFPYNTMASLKINSEGQVLNLPPLVDFEVREKRKVDIIVDVGNIDLNLNEVKDKVNEIMQPTLAAEGLDYNIHVEKSNEGKTRQYYAEYTVDSSHFLFNRYGPI